MDAGSFSFSPEKIRQISQKPLDRVVFIPSLRNTCSNSWASWNSGDRFIPDRSAMDFDVARYLLSQPNKKEEENPEIVSPAKVAYRKLLAETLLNNRTRIMSFNRKPTISADSMLSSMAETCNSSSGTTKSTNNKKKKRFISQKAERILDAPDLADDFYLNLLDWGSRNVLSIALGNTVYLWNASNSSVSELMSVEDEIGRITSVSWAADGHHLAVGLENSDVQLWDSTSAKLLRTLKGIHGSRVGALAWNNCVLTTGGMDGKIVNNDVRIRSPQVKSFMGHREQVCGLKWSASGKQLASGGNDNLIHIWDLSAASSNQNQWLHRFDDHNAAVKALAWCPFSNNLLASGGGGSDRCIKFWNTCTGACLNSVDTGSQVSGLQWSKNERELLSSHGFTGNHLTLWKYPTMVKLTELHGHTSRVLHLAQSPNGCTVATAAGDETLRFWNVFGNPEADKPARTTTYSEAFANLSRLR